MNRPHVTPITSTPTDNLTPGQWISLSEALTETQRIGVILSKEYLSFYFPNVIKVVWYEGLTIEDIHEDLTQYQSYIAYFDLDRHVEGGIAGVWTNLDTVDGNGCVWLTMDGVLTNQPEYTPGPGPEIPNEEDLLPEEVLLEGLQVPTSPVRLSNTSTYQTFLRKYAIKTNSLLGVLPITRSIGAPNRYINKRLLTPYKKPMSNLKQVVVIDEEGGRIIPEALVPEGYVKVDVYKVFSKTKDAPVVEDAPGTVEDGTVLLELDTPGNDLSEDYYAKLKEEIIDQLSRSNGDALVKYTDPRNEVTITMDPATGPDQSAYMIVKRGPDGTLSYTEAPKDLHDTIDYNLSIPITEDTHPDQ